MPFVFVPGLGLDERSCVATMGRLDRSSGVIPLPGYGMTARRTDDVSPPALGRALVNQIERRRLPQAVLVGHSASCQVVAEPAGQAPLLASGLVLIGPTTDCSARSWPRLAAPLAGDRALGGPSHGALAAAAVREDLPGVDAAVHGRGPAP